MEKLREGLTQLGSLGIKLNTGVSINHLLEDDLYGTLALNHKVGGEFYTHLVYLLGCWKLEKEGEQWISNDYCNRVWYRDGETDSFVPYGDFIERMNEVSGNRFDFSEVENLNICPLDLEEDEYEKAREQYPDADGYYGCSFKLKGKSYQWMFEGEDDWIDPEFYFRFFNLVEAEYGAEEATCYLYFEFGQGLVIIYLPRKQHNGFIDLLTLSGSAKLKYFVQAALAQQEKIQKVRIEDFSTYSQQRLIEVIDEVFEELKYNEDPILLNKSKRLEQELRKRGEQQEPDSLFDSVRSFLKKF